MSITGEQGERVALYLDESMKDKDDAWTVVAASETGGYYDLGGAYRLPSTLTYAEARDEVVRLSQAVLGLDEEQASEIVLASFRNQNKGA